jgi:hypothetical protein
MKRFTLGVVMAGLSACGANEAMGTIADDEPLAEVQEELSETRHLGMTDVTILYPAPSLAALATAGDIPPKTTKTKSK